MVDTEVEIRPVGLVAQHSHEGHPHEHDHGRDPAHEHAHDHAHGHLAHVAVVERPVGDGTVPSLVFGELRAGRYDLFEKGRPDDVVLTLEVEGGQVATASWPLVRDTARSRSSLRGRAAPSAPSQPLRSRLQPGSRVAP